MAKYKLTPKRRQSILRAQAISARKRKTYGTALIKFTLNKGADLVSKGGASKASDFFEGNEKRSKRSRKAKRKAAKVRRRRGY